MTEEMTGVIMIEEIAGMIEEVAVVVETEVEEEEDNKIVKRVIGKF